MPLKRKFAIMIKRVQRKKGVTHDVTSRKVTQKMREANLDSFLVTSPYNLRYLTNFTGTTGLAVITLESLLYYGLPLYRTSGCASARFEIIKNVAPIFEEVADLTRKEGLEESSI